MRSSSVDSTEEMFLFHYKKLTTERAYIVSNVCGSGHNLQMMANAYNIRRGFMRYVLFNIIIICKEKTS